MEHNDGSSSQVVVAVATVLGITFTIAAMVRIIEFGGHLLRGIP